MSLAGGFPAHSRSSDHPAFCPGIHLVRPVIWMSGTVFPRLEVRSSSLDSDLSPSSTPPVLSAVWRHPYCHLLRLFSFHRGFFCFSLFFFSRSFVLRCNIKILQLVTPFSFSFVFSFGVTPQWAH
jgi:hypothetical protein